MLVTERDETPFEPPPDSRAARLAQFQRDRPALYAARHVALATLQVTLPLLGLGALVLGLLPQVDWSWAAGIGAFVRSLLERLGAWIPDIRPPFALPREWLVWLRQSGIIATAKWVVPIVIAVFVAIEEYQRHQRKRRGKRGPE